MNFEENARTSATQAWCRVTNALIAKYKPMAEKDPMNTILELYSLERLLLNQKYLTDEELERAL